MPIIVAIKSTINGTNMESTANSTKGTLVFRRKIVVSNAKKRRG
ncbi:hypothetical protein [Palaeococcus sp. (in: euryarchaeotes)]